VSYIIFSSSTHLGVGDQTDGNIWIAEVDDPPLPGNPQNALFQIVNVRAAPPNDARPRSEGEVFVRPAVLGGPVVYYMHKRMPGDQNLPAPTSDCGYLGSIISPADQRNYSIRRTTTNLIPVP
jgi:hypothetical protein